MRSPLTPALLALALFLTGCGQKGPLFLPPPDAGLAPATPERTAAERTTAEPAPGQ